VERQCFEYSLETTMENWDLSSDEMQDGNAPELDVIEGTRYIMLGIDVTLPFFSVILIRLVTEIENLILYLLSLITACK
jgi:hypothetical protein